MEEVRYLKSILSCCGLYSVVAPFWRQVSTQFCVYRKATSDLANIEVFEVENGSNALKTEATANSAAKRNTPNGTSEASLQQLNRTGLLTAIAIALHNFPEGLATFVSVLVSPSVGIPVAIAIAIHVRSMYPIYFSKPETQTFALFS